jgi:hypothetical protein
MFSAVKKITADDKTAANQNMARAGLERFGERNVIRTTPTQFSSG